MPNRILHERICVSETIAQLTADEERFFYRLIVQCDDYGRFDGRASVIRARCFALQLDEVEDEDVARWLAVMERVGLVVMYEVDGRIFLQVTTWERYQQTRAKRSKYPDPEGGLPESASNGYQAPADVPVYEKRETRSEKRSSIDEKREARSDTPAVAEDDHGADAPPKPKRAKPRGAKPRTDPPETLEPNDADYAAGARAGLSPEEVDSKAVAMLDWHRKEGKDSADWHASLRTWLDRAPIFDQPRASPNHRNGSSRPPPNWSSQEPPPRETEAVPMIEPDPAAQNVWSAALDELRLGMSEANYSSYLAGTYATALASDRLTVAVSNPLVRETLAQRFRQHVARAVLDVVGRPLAVAFVNGRTEAAPES